MRTKVIADLGINTQGSLDIAKEIIRACNLAGVDYVKFQKRNPDVCVPENQKYVPKTTMWGTMDYIDYRWRMEFTPKQYGEIDNYCKSLGQKWFMSVWDRDSLQFSLKYDHDFVKIPSAKLTDHVLLRDIVHSGRKAILSTGGCDIEMVHEAVNTLGDSLYCLMQCTSTYPCVPEEINLNCIELYKKLFPKVKIGYSNHFAGMTGNLGSIALGAEMLELHVTLNTTMLGSDHSASCPTDKLPYLIKHIETMEAMLGDGKKQYYESERPVMAKLR